MYQGRDVEISNRIGRTLLAIMPADAESITATAQVADDWDEISFAFRDAHGTTGWFSMHDHPDEAARDIVDALADLRRLMSENGQEAWTHAEFAVGRDQHFDVAFSYEDYDNA